MARGKIRVAELEELRRFYQSRAEKALRKSSTMEGFRSNPAGRHAYAVADRLLPKDTRRRKLLAGTIGKAARYAIKAARTRPGPFLSGFLTRLYPPSLFFVRPLVFPRQTEPTVSIVLLAYNQFRYTYRCLSSLLAYTHDVPYEIILVDNGSFDSTPQMISMLENVTVLRFEDNVGPLRANNAGARMARGKYLLFLNNDTRFTMSWLHPLVKMMEDDPTIGIAGPKLILSNGRLQQAGSIIWNRQHQRTADYGWGDDPQKPEYNYVKEADYVMGACLIIRRSLFERIGGFSEEYITAYYEDTDIAMESRRLGYKVVYQPNSEVIHYGGVTLRPERSLPSYWAANGKTFYNKWKSTLEKENLTGEEDIFLARDRSKLKTVALVLVPHLPRWHKDPHDLALVQYIRALSSLGVKVILWPHNLLRRDLCTSELQQMGIEVMHGSLDFALFIRSYGKYLHVVIMAGFTSAEYLCFLDSHSGAKTIFVCRASDFCQEFQPRPQQTNVQDYLSVPKEMALRYLTRFTDLTIVTTKEEKRILGLRFPHLDLAVWPTPGSTEPLEAHPKASPETINCIDMTLADLGIGPRVCINSIKPSSWQCCRPETWG